MEQVLAQVLEQVLAQVLEQVLAQVLELVLGPLQYSGWMVNDIFPIFM